MNSAGTTTSSASGASDCLAASSATESNAAERELIRETLDGSASAAREIVRLHHGRIFSFICRMTRHPQDAEDITQETFIKAFRSLQRFDTRRPMVNWLFTIARRTALNHFRSARNWVALPDDAPSSQQSPASSMEERDQIEDLWERARRVLAPREFEVMWLRFGENLSIEETARVTGLTHSNIKILVFRSRQRMLQTTAQP